MKNYEEILIANKLALKALGIDTENAIEVDIQFRPDEMPKVKVTSLMTEKHRFQKLVEEFELKPKEKQC